MRDCPVEALEGPKVISCSNQQIRPSTSAKHGKQKTKGTGRDGSEQRHLAASMVRVKGCEQDAVLTFVINSGASHHLVPSSGLLRNCTSGKSVCLADGTKCPLTQSGSLFCSFLQESIGAFVVPGLSCCLQSVAALLADGYRVCFENNVFYFQGWATTGQCGM